MMYRTLFPLAALALVACAAQTTRPPPEEPVSTTSVTSAALTTRAAKPTRFTTGPAPEDAPETFAPIEPRFKAALAANPALRNVDYGRISIEEDDGTVILRGRVPTSADAVQIEMTIRAMKGVTSVDNRLRTWR